MIECVVWVGGRGGGESASASDCGSRVGSIAVRDRPTRRSLRAHNLLSLSPSFSLSLSLPLSLSLSLSPPASLQSSGGGGEGLGSLQLLLTVSQTTVGVIGRVTALFTVKYGPYKKYGSYDMAHVRNMAHII